MAIDGIKFYDGGISSVVGDKQQNGSAWKKIDNTNA
jgi:hypothetical protein